MSEAKRKTEATPKLKNGEQLVLWCYRVNMCIVEGNSNEKSFDNSKASEFWINYAHGVKRELQKWF